MWATTTVLAVGGVVKAKLNCWLPPESEIRAVHVSSQSPLRAQECHLGHDTQGPGTEDIAVSISNY